MKIVKLTGSLIFLSFMILVAKGNMVMANSPIYTKNFTKEKQLNSLYSNEINSFWQLGIFGHFTGVHNARVNYAAFVEPPQTEQRRACLVIIPGRSEGYLKYQELAFDLFQHGYDIFIIDHRGQGISERLLANPHKGYVDSFEDYSDDVHMFTETIVKQHCSEKPHLLSHSMGGIIAARFLQKHPDSVKSAVLSSPMIAINSGAIPQWLAKALVYSTVQLNQWFSDSPWYFIGQGDVADNAYHMDSFANNPLMQSQLRYQQFTQLYQSTPALQLGGVTAHWLAQALEAEQTVFNNLPKLTVPILVLQAGADSVVDNERQNEFCYQLNKLQPRSCPNGKPVTIEHARHELFFESDHYREEAIHQTLNWFKTFN